MHSDSGAALRSERELRQIRITQLETETAAIARRVTWRPLIGCCVEAGRRRGGGESAVRPGQSCCLLCPVRPRDVSAWCLCDGGLVSRHDGVPRLRRRARGGGGVRAAPRHCSRAPEHEPAGHRLRNQKTTSEREEVGETCPVFRPWGGSVD